MSGLRDYEVWHQDYDDPESNLSHRLAVVQSLIRGYLDERPGPIRVLGLCSGDARDLLDVLAERQDRARVRGTLVELHPAISARARDRIAELGLTGLTMITGDAGTTATFPAAAPVDLLLLVGIMGNIVEADKRRLAEFAATACDRDALVIWTHGAERDGSRPPVAQWFADAGFTEASFHAEPGFGYGVGTGRWRHEAGRMPADERLFTFVR